MNLPKTVRNGDRCDAFECLFGIRTIQVWIYFFTLKEPRTIIEIAEYIARDRTTALRLTNGLVEKRLLIKKAEKLEKGGIRYRYYGVEEHELKKELLARLESLREAIQYFVDLDWTKLEEEIEEEMEQRREKILAKALDNKLLIERIKS